MVIRRLTDKEKVPWRLLLLADPSREIVEKYLKNGSLYVALIDNKIIGEYVLINNSKEAVELKNIAVDKKHQGQGLGKKLVLDAIQKAKELGANVIEVGTGNSSLSQLALYKNAALK